MWEMTFWTLVLVPWKPGSVVLGGLWFDGFEEYLVYSKVLLRL